MALTGDALTPGAVARAASTQERDANDQFERDNRYRDPQREQQVDDKPQTDERHDQLPAFPHRHPPSSLLYRREVVRELNVSIAFQARWS